MKIRYKEEIIDEEEELLIETRLLLFKDSIDDLASLLYAGTITLGEWQESMKSEIRDLHLALAVIVVGGFSLLTLQDIERLAPGLTQQYEFLQKFAQYIYDNVSTVSLESIMSRAFLYGQSAMQVIGRMKLPVSIEKLLPYMPRDGSTECMMHCYCGWNLRVLSNDGNKMTVEAVWTLSPAEHCGTCSDRSGHREIIEVPYGTEVPPSIGFYGK